MKLLISTLDSVGLSTKISNHLKKFGHNVFEDRSSANLSGSKKREQQSKLAQTLKNVDILIIELNESVRTGFVIANALNEKKFVIGLKKQSKTKKDNGFLESTDAKNFISVEYSEKNLIKVIEEALETAKDRLDTKFILIISPEIDRYLDWASQNKRMHKAQIVRNSIEGAMKKDREYREYLEGK